MGSSEVWRAPGAAPPVRAATEAPRVFLSTLTPGRAQRRLASTVVLVSVAVFAAAAPFAKTPLPQVPAFIPAYQSALIINDVLTALLLFGQFGILRSPALLVLASGYMFSAFMAIFHALTFPGLFAPSGLLGAGGQTTAWLYFLWHGGFALFVLAYAWLRDEPEEGRRQKGGPGALAAWAVLGSFAAAGGLAVLTTAGHDVLPVIMRGNSDDSAKVIAAGCTWALAALALAVLWRRRPHSMIDLWLMVALCAWLFSIALAAVLNAGRFDLGFYAGRIYGLLAASFVLGVLLLENSRLHAGLVEVQKINMARQAAALERARASLAEHAERLRILREIERSVLAEQPPEEIAAAVIQPLRALLDVPRAIVNRFDLEAGTVEWIAGAGRRRTHVGPGVRYSIALMGDLDALRRGEPQRIDVHALPPSPETAALLASGVHAYMAVPMIAGGELLGALSFGGESEDFPPATVNIAQEVAAQLAIALAQARLLERVKGHAEQLESQVAQRTEELRAANRELESFSYSVSHDLRAPLRAVDGYARMIEEDYGDRLDSEGRRLLAVVRESSRNMGRLIDELLAFSRLGRQAPAKSLVDMNALAREVADELAGTGAAALEIASLPPALADRALLRQVWVNLIGNALKYSAKAAVPRVEVGGRSDGSGNEYWVQDNGVGFDMRYAGKLFGVFQRLHRAEEFEGTGVGLAIVQRVVARHGGQVRAEGKPGEGARFSFTLPNQQAA